MEYLRKFLELLNHHAELRAEVERLTCDIERGPQAEQWTGTGETTDWRITTKLLPDEPVSVPGKEFRFWDGKNAGRREVLGELVAPITIALQKIPRAQGGEVTFSFAEVDIVLLALRAAGYGR